VAGGSQLKSFSIALIFPFIGCADLLGAELPQRGGFVQWVLDPIRRSIYLFRWS